MEPLHQGLPRKALYSTSKMSSVTVCLDSGKRATDACKSDIRGDRTETVLCYPEDRPKGTCESHVQMSICSGGGVANEYCKKFAAVDSKVKLENKSLLKLTENEFNTIKRAKGAGLEAMYTQDNYVYLVDSKGNDVSFKGFSGNINKNNKAPYKVCTAHTESSWESYVASHPISSLFW